jgi:hypothetical protein
MGPGYTINLRRLLRKIAPLTDENDPGGSQRQRQLQVILQLLRKASKHADAEQGAKLTDTSTSRA